MRIYPKLIPTMAREIVQLLTKDGDIEVLPESMDAAREDFASIIRQYQIQEESVTDDAKTLLIRRDWPRSKLAEAKRIVAAQRRIPVGDDGVDFIINQMLEFMFMSNNIEEVYAQDHTMRKKIVTILRKYFKIDEEVDKEVRAKLKHLQEGTSDWEIQYKRVLEQVRRRKGLI